MSEGGDRNTVTLGGEDYTVVAQPYPRLFRQLSEFGEQLQEMGELDASDAGSVVASLGSRVHSFLRIFIPNLMSENQFAGLDADGEFDPVAEDKAPTLPQIIGAVETAFEVNGGKRLGELLGKLLGPAMGQQVQRLVAATIGERLSQASMSSPSPKAGAQPNGSTTPSPTPAPAGVTEAEAIGMSSGARGRVASPSPVS